MADVYEQNLASKSTLTTTDYIRVVGSDNVSYKQLVSDVAKKIIENYTGSTLAGSAQSVKSAVDSLNSNSLKTVIQSTATATVTNTTNLNDLELGFYGFNFWINGSSPSGSGQPSEKTLGLLLHMRLASNSYMQIILGQDYVATRTRSATNTAWTAWKKVAVA